MTSHFISLNIENSLDTANFFLLNSADRLQVNVRLSVPKAFGIGIHRNTGVAVQIKQFVSVRYDNGVFTRDAVRNNAITLHQSMASMAPWRRLVIFTSWSDQLKLVVLNSSRYRDNRDTRSFAGEVYSVAVNCRGLSDDELAKDAEL